MLFPWQTKQWQTLWHSKNMGRLPHALLLSGIRGLGKEAFAQHFVRAILCQTHHPQGMLCDESHQQLCHACRLIQTNAHPNLIFVKLDAEDNIIKVETIRDAISFINQTSFSDGMRFLIINPAHAMNHAAANALLKTLEEPAKGAMIILITNQSQKLPATVRSRCHIINFHKPERTEAINWLQQQNNHDDKYDMNVLLEMANGAPLLAGSFMNHDYLSLRADLYQKLISITAGLLEPTIAAKNLMEQPPEIQFEFLITFLLDLLRLQLGGKVDLLRNQDFKQQLVALQNKTNLNKNLQLVHYIKELQQTFHHGVPLNKQLAIESVLIKWSECLSAEELCT